MAMVKVAKKQFTFVHEKLNLFSLDYKVSFTSAFLGT